MKKINKEKLLKFCCYGSVLFFVVTIFATILLAKSGGGGSTTLWGYKLFSDFAETLAYCVVDNPYNGTSGII